MNYLARILWVIGFATVVINASLAAESHRIQPGDTLKIAVLNRLEYAQEVVVQQDGMLHYFLMDPFQAAGLTPDELRDRIRDGIKSRVTDAQVIVVPVPRENEVYVGGQVNAPGRFTFTEPSIDLRRAVSLGGDVLEPNGNRKKVYLFPVDGDASEHDLTAADKSVAVHRGDAVYVAERVRVEVSGNVQKPETYFFDEPVAVGYALSKAGGIVDDKGSLADIAILRRDGSVETLSLSERFFADLDKQPTLSHGDGLYVPNAYAIEEISVIGYVQKPGLHKVRGPIPIGRALALAGGIIVDEAKRDEAVILRLDDSREIINMKTDAQRVLVYPGETVQVERRFQVNWSLLFGAVSTGALIWQLVKP
ncbi:MAG: SLBB domain-containing protein [Candidatus Poribacteria bacterium]|nr:SLBB domain-containing protein [Candidatus Poribacteria bacterium]